ncbi:MAG: maf [Patescibacteria group bacterium]|nr:maf [Patescibacteria group bacterium]
MFLDWLYYTRLLGFFLIVGLESTLGRPKCYYGGMKHLILASSSPRRKELLALTGAPFEVIASEFEEDNSIDLPPGELVAQLALGKAQWVADKHPEAVVIGSDTLIALDGRVIGKQTDRAELIETLTALSGRSHSAFSGLAIIEGDRVVTESLETKVFFRQLEAAEIERYADTADWQGLAGGYGIQSTAAVFIERVEGDYLTVVGLPLCRLSVLLKEFGVELLAGKTA